MNDVEWKLLKHHLHLHIYISFVAQPHGFQLYFHLAFTH